MTNRFLVFVLIASFAIAIYTAQTNDVFRITATMEPAYICETNDLFAVCVFDLSNKVLLRFKGVYIGRKELPWAGSGLTPTRVHIFDCGEGPQLPVDSRDPEAWKPRREIFHRYGKIPYPIKDIDPPIEKCLSNKGDLLLGFSLRDRFYVVCNLGKSTGKAQVMPLQKHALFYVKVPMHRTNEVIKVTEQFLKKKVESQ